MCLLALLGIVITATADTYKITGRITDTTGEALPGASVSLLDPQDSTLAVFGISNVEGGFALTEVKEGQYVLQVAVMGYYTAYRPLTVNAALVNDLGAIALQVNESAHLLNEVVISGEKVPIRLKGDTLEYNAGSFKVKPDAVVEDLLRKLPGVQVDKEGNIKSMGKNVSKVLVDGKEFFSGDPKVATKNLPADAIDKIQAFEKRSDESLFTGIDDGSREQTLNLLLKDNKKTGYFGEAKIAGGLPEQYEASARAFKFRKKSQLAALGMLNNINKFGFTFQDYIDMNGGLSSLLRGGGTLSLSSDVPVDFGQPIPGKITSGAAGLNYSLEPWEKSRLNFSYMGSGIDKFLDQYASSTNVTGNGTFRKADHSEENSDNLSHLLRARFRGQTDSFNFFTLNLVGKLGNSNNETRLLSESYQAAILQNRLDNSNTAGNDVAELSGEGGWTRKGLGKWPVLKATAEGSYSRSQEGRRWYNQAYFPLGGYKSEDQQYRNNELRKTNIGASASAVRSLGSSYYLEPSVSVAYDKESLDRRQGPLSNESIAIDSLSPGFYRTAMNISPGIELQRLQKSEQWHAALRWTSVRLTGREAGRPGSSNTYAYFLPSLRWQRDIATGKRFSARYTTALNNPVVQQMLPVTDYSNPLLRVTGNTVLRPEYTHNLALDYSRFDQFNMSSFFAGVNGSYTRDKIGWSRNVAADLSQDLLAVNTDYALQGMLHAQYSRPVRKLGVQLTAGLQENWNKTLSPVNGTGNINNTFSHRLEVSCNNLNSDVWDLRGGGSIQVSTAAYSLNKELNNTYYNYTGFASIGLRPTENWNFAVSCDMTYYASRSFDAPVTIPLVKAEITRYIFKNQRGAIGLVGFDLLDKNKAIVRTSQLNFLMEQRSNIIGRYVMLSFSYKLNRAGRKSDGGGIKINHR